MDHSEHTEKGNTSEAQEAESQRLERLADRVQERKAEYSTTESAADERLAALRQAQSDEAARARNSASDAPNSSSPAEMEALNLEKHHRELDSSVLHKLERDFGRDIGEDRLREAREHPTRFQSHVEYQEGLREAYPDLTDGDRESVVGDLRDGSDRHVDAQQIELPATVAHEQLHHLNNGNFRREFGDRMDEGTTEHLSRKAVPGLSIRDRPEGYPDEEKFVGMLEARVGPALAHAYFSGDIGPMRKEFDAQLGEGALERFEALTRQGRLDEARDLLKGIS